MIPQLFKIGPLTINSFGVMAMLAFLVPTLLLRKEVARKGLNPDLANGIAIAAMIGGFLGARIYYIIERWHLFLQHPADYIFTGAGLVWYGGLFGGFIAATWYIHKNNVSIPLICDLMAPLLALGQAFGRMGCLLSGDGDYGPPADVPWAMSFPRGIIPTSQRVHPTPIYDMLILLGIFTFLWKIRKREMPTGFKFSLYLILLGAGRIFTEFYRNTPKVLWGLTMAQWISIALILIGGAIILNVRGRTSRQGGTMPPRVGVKAKAR
ncbi:MAG: prolipoprotein diacylglyceryl transferase [Calditrichaeota bacterium]|nr:MAG: prolipoprotein diacylglyceryl transferase [Calditrichota bacterium]